MRFGAGADMGVKRFGDFADMGKYSQKFAVNGVYQRYSPSFCGEANISVGENLRICPKFFLRAQYQRYRQGQGNAGAGLPRPPLDISND